MDPVFRRRPGTAPAPCIGIIVIARGMARICDAWRWAISPAGASAAMADRPIRDAPVERPARERAT